MQTKLTLRLDDALISFGKAWARQHGKSLSGVITDYLQALETLSTTDVAHQAPLTHELLGLAKTTDPVSEADYQQYLENKYL